MVLTSAMVLRRMTSKLGRTKEMSGLRCTAEEKRNHPLVCNDKLLVL
jgi:hypothetical protein